MKKNSAWAGFLATVSAFLFPASFFSDFGATERHENTLQRVKGIIRKEERNSKPGSRQKHTGSIKEGIGFSAFLGGFDLGR